MSAYNKLRSIAGNLKTLSPQVQGVAEDVNPFNSLESSKIHFRKNGYETKYERTTNLNTGGGKKRFVLSNDNGWISSVSFSVFLPRTDANGATIHWKYLTILYLIKQVQIRIGNTEIHRYDAQGLFNILSQANFDSIRRQIFALSTPSLNDAGTEYEADSDFYEINIALPTVGTKLNYNADPEDFVKKLPFPIGRCNGDLIVDITMNPLEECVEGVSGVNPFSAPQTYEDLRVNYENWVLIGESGAVIDEKSSMEGNNSYVYQTYALECLQSQEIVLNDVADAVYKIENIRKDGELLTVMLNVVDDLDANRFSNSKIRYLSFKLGNDTVFEADSRRSIPIQLLNILRNDTGYQPDERNSDFADLIQCPVSADPMNWQSSVYYGANPDKKSMSLTLRRDNSASPNQNIAVQAFYRAHVHILSNGNIVHELVPTTD